MNKTILLISLFFLITTFTISGCWDRKELDRIAFVQTFGVDQSSPEDEYIEMTILIGKPMGSNDSENSSNGELPYYLATSEEKAPRAALANFINFSTRQMNLQHNLNIILGREIAENGVESVIDSIIRCRECRPETYMFVSSGKAKEFLENANSRMEPLPSTALVGLMENTEGPYFAYPVRIIDFIKDYLAEGKDSAAPLVEVKNNASETVENNKSENNGGENSENSKEEEKSDTGEIIISGMAVFKKDKMVGVLKDEAASGVLWLIGQKTGQFIIEHPEVGNITISNVSGNTSFDRYLVKENRLIIEISAKGDISDWPSLKKRINRELLTSLEKAMEEKIKEETYESLDTLQKLESDIIGFGQYISRYHPHEWLDLKNDWPGTYKNLDVVVSVSSKINSTGFIR